MKKLHLLVFLMFSTITLFSQPYLSTGLTTKGFVAQLGVLHKQIDIFAGVKFPISEQTNSRVFNLSIGKQFLISNYDDGDNYSFTPAIGIAIYKISTFNYRSAEIVYQSTKAIYSLELGKDSYCGRGFVRVWYCNEPYIEIGLKFFTDKR